MQQKKEKSLSNRLLYALIVSVVSLGVSAAAPAKRPALVVGITVEGLNEDYLHLLRDYFSEDGFKRLMREGVLLQDVCYGAGIDPSAATAILYTGASPSVNGIPSGEVYDAAIKRGRNILLDTAQIGNFTDETYSPKALLVSTISDEIRRDAAATGMVYSISPDATNSIIMAGHSANSAFWINDATGQWATTTYYKDVPQPVMSRNYHRPLSTVLDTLQWKPTLALPLYPDVPQYKLAAPFRYVFPKRDINRYKNFKTAAPVNNEITSIASDYLSFLSLGKHSGMDMLNIGYTLTPYPYSADADNRVETMDAYLRLDKDLSKLFGAIDRRMGRDNTLVFLAGLPPRPQTKSDESRWGIPSGQFSARKAMSLLNMYLMALHGNGEWVEGYHDRHVFLNHRGIKENGLNLATVRAEAAEFLNRMSGVSNVFTIDDIIAARAGNEPDVLKRNTSVKHAGDIIISINPGWECVDDTGSGPSSIANEAHTPSPTFIMGPGIEPRTISTPVDARAIAPTITRLLRIRSPNAASVPALRF